MTKLPIIIKSYRVTGDEHVLLIRGTWSAAIFGASSGSAFVVVGLGLMWMMLTQPSTGPAYPFSHDSLGDRLATFAAAVFFGGTFAGAGMATIVYPLRNVLLPWRLDRRSGNLARGKRQWKLDTIQSLRVRADYLWSKPISVSILLEMDAGKQVRVLRNFIRRRKTLFDCQAESVDESHRIAEWLNVPMRTSTVITAASARPPRA